MNKTKFITADAKEGLSRLPDKSVNCIVTSPPYYGLRDYGIDGQIGLEKTPEEYITNLVDVFREAKRVLRDDGTLWVNIGDCYAGSGKGAARYPENAKKYKQGTSKGMLGTPGVTKVGFGNCKPKDLIGIPWMLAFALRDDGWYLRSDIIWNKPNAMPESVKDRCTKSHEYIFLFSKSRKYYYDADAIKEPCSPKTKFRAKSDNPPRYGGNKYTKNPDVFYRTKSGNAYQYHEKRNKRDVWSVSTKPYKEAHFATFPPDLVEPCILAGCPENGIVLDFFAGSGTVGFVAKKYNRGFILIDLNPGYIELAKRRCLNDA